MKKVHLFLESSIKSRAAFGAAGYVLTIETDGTPDDARAVRAILPVRDMTGHQAQIYAATEGIGRLKEPVALHVWTDDFLIASAFGRGWLKSWKEKEFDGIKNADEWRILVTMIEGVGMVLDDVTIHMKEPHAFRAWLEWECKRTAKEAERGEGCLRSTEK